MTSVEIENNRLATRSTAARADLVRRVFRRFVMVVATDVSDEQVSHATPVANVEYRVAPAENSGIEIASVNAVTVAQALHWFDHPYLADQSPLRSRLQPVPSE